MLDTRSEFFSHLQRQTNVSPYSIVSNLITPPRESKKASLLLKSKSPQKKLEQIALKNFRVTQGANKFFQTGLQFEDGTALKNSLQNDTEIGIHKSIRKGNKITAPHTKNIFGKGIKNIINS